MGDFPCDMNRDLTEVVPSRPALVYGIIRYPSGYMLLEWVGVRCYIGPHTSLIPNLSPTVKLQICLFFL